MRRLCDGVLPDSGFLSVQNTTTLATFVKRYSLFPSFFFRLAPYIRMSQERGVPVMDEV